MGSTPTGGPKKYCGVEQWSACEFHKLEVGGSNPSTATKTKFFEIDINNKKVMLASFTQTYGDDRLKLHEIYSRDKRLIEFKNHFDLNIHSFHNCNLRTIENYKKLNKVKNSEYLIFNDVPYSFTIKALKIKLKNIGCTHFFFTQDDTFSADNDDINWDELIEYVNVSKGNFMLNLYYNIDHINFSLKPNVIKNSFNVYNLTTADFARETWAGMDDQAYICTLDLLPIIYDSLYEKKEDVWNCEMYLKEKFSKSVIPRLVTDKTIFKNYNILGRTVHKRLENIRDLYRKNLYAG